tara:strand:+ start:341 stop:634 length:294 start_codon:yes stop_codon:yes gene_type:complete
MGFGPFRRWTCVAKRAADVDRPGQLAFRRAARKIAPQIVVDAASVEFERRQSALEFAPRRLFRQGALIVTMLPAPAMARTQPHRCVKTRRKSQRRHQ